jgi:hypothetical protein
MLGALPFLPRVGRDLAAGASVGLKLRTQLRPGDREITSVDEGARVWRAGSERRSWRGCEKLLLARRWVGHEDTCHNCGQGRDHGDRSGDENGSSRAGWGVPLVAMLSHGADPLLLLTEDVPYTGIRGQGPVEHPGRNVPGDHARDRALTTGRRAPGPGEEAGHPPGDYYAS